ncbi:proteasome assembly chaperone 2-like [Schistocerca gregaria]|uniref:proteasome assembly chaperone 2-like n=1 Tax=Schistocerca gregaria TaxID=7010 RepID=UPI00211F0CA4|nr:proteasome assembly chaperone 2-like [Schistocerca gregaria]
MLQPALSIGNLGQLTVDALISNFSIPCVGYFDEEFVVPVAGNDVFTQENSGVLSTAIEVYHAKLHDAIPVTLVQQRSSIITGYGREYAEHLFKWIKSERFRETIVILGLNSSMRIDSQLAGSQFRYVATPLEAGKKKRFERCELIPLEEPLTAVLRPGSIARRLHQLAENEKLPLVVLARFVHGGYSVQESIETAKLCAQYLSLPNENIEAPWKLPTSWKHIMQTLPFDQKLFG